MAFRVEMIAIQQRNTIPRHSKSMIYALEKEHDGDEREGNVNNDQRRHVGRSRVKALCNLLLRDTLVFECHSRLHLCAEYHRIQ